MKNNKNKNTHRTAFESIFEQTNTTVGVFCQIYTEYFLRTSTTSTSQNKIPPRTIFEFVSGKPNATIAASLQIYTEYFQRTVSTTSISNLYLKTITMLRVLRQIYTEYYHRNTNVTSHGLRH